MMMHSDRTRQQEPTDVSKHHCLDAKLGNRLPRELVGSPLLEMKLKTQL